MLRTRALTGFGRSHNTNSVRQYGSVRVNDETAPSMAHNAGKAVLTGLPVLSDDLMPPGPSSSAPSQWHQGNFVSRCVNVAHRKGYADVNLTRLKILWLQRTRS